MGTTVKDVDWIRQAFMLPSSAIREQDRIRRVLTDASFKFTDTTLGGGYAINTPPQFTRYADIKARSRSPFSLGLGRYYSDAIEDNSQYIQMRFGTPQYNSLSNFFINFYNPEAATLARTGRGTSVFFEFGKALGTVVSLPAQPLIWIGNVFNFLFNKPVSRFYYLKPAMPSYWSAVNTIVNQVAVNMGIVPRNYTPDEELVMGKGPNYTQADIERFHQLMPDIFRKEGGVDVYAVASKYQRMWAENKKLVDTILREATNQQDLQERLWAFHNTKLTSTPPAPRFEDYIQRYTNLSVATPPTGEETGGESTGLHFETLRDFADQTQSEFNYGTDWVTFKVDHTGTTAESFSNSVGESELALKINSMSGASRETRFSLADGNVIGGMFSSVVDTIRDIGSGVAESLKIHGLAALAGSAFADIPKTWKESTADLPQSSYTIELRSPYGNSMSRFQNLIVPLAMILASALPVSTGRQSYTSPFLCELYSKGRSQVRLGMVTSLSVTRGTGNVGWTQNQEPLGIDISFTVTDLSSVLHMPIKPAISTLGGITTAIARTAGAAAAEGYEGGLDAEGGANLGERIAAAADKSTFDDDSAFTDYMAVLGSLGFADQVYIDNKRRLRELQRHQAYETWKSPRHAANKLMGSWPARLVRQTATATDYFTE